MSGSDVAADVILSAGFAAIGAAALYASRKMATREQEAERTEAPTAALQPPGAIYGSELEAMWTKDLAALAMAIQNAAPEAEPAATPVRASAASIP